MNTSTLAHLCRRTALVAVLGIATLSAGCNNGSSSSNGGGGGNTTNPNGGRTFFIKPGPNATNDMLVAMVQLAPKDIMQFDCGFFDLSSGIQINSTEEIEIRGCGREKTVLSFRDSASQEGILAINTRGLTIKDLTVLDSPGDGIKLKGVNFGTLSHVRTIWSSGRLTDEEDTITASNFSEKLNVACTDPARHNPANNNPLESDTTSPDYNVSVASGRYGVYPVESENILVEFSESIGASDAGIYVGQTDNTIIRNSRTAFNVFGFEIENVRGGEYANNVAECNTGGFLIYDLDGLTRYGKRTRVYGNIARNNNTYNFAEPGSIVSNVPRGSGILTLAYDFLDIFDNVIEDNSTGGIIHTSYALFGVPGDRRMDMYTEGVHIWNNVFRNNGTDLPTPDVATIVATGGDQVTSVFPMLVGLKNAAANGQYTGAHILFDGYEDEYDPDCPYPLDENGQQLPADEDGKPISGNRYPNPDCRYTKYKFDSNGERIVPKWWFSCIDADNQFDEDSPAFANFHGTRGVDLLLTLGSTDPAVVIDSVAGLQDFASDLDMAPHDCPTRFGSNLPALAPVVIPPFTPSGGFDPAPTQQRINELCNVSTPVGHINAAAYEVNCPTLDQYHLFSNAEDPMSLPNGNSVPFVLNTKLFSDYSTKYRVAFIPQGKSAQYRTLDDGVNSTIHFPVGTIISKTFAFADETAGTEVAAETRLLIKRQRRDGHEYWDGVEYIWKTVGGKRVAQLTQEGGTANVSWNYHDVQSGVLHQGSTSAYLLPNASQCVTCHGNNDNETGTPPIGPKARNLNRPYGSESPIAHGIDSHGVNGVNQLQYWCSNGFLSNCPSPLGVDPTSQIAANAERIPAFNVPGDSGFPADSAQDKEARVRAYLETNCAHCHNPAGQASNTGFYLDVKRAVNSTYGICKGPTATGSEGRGGRLVDIHPGDVSDSIVPFRMGPDATAIAARMPPIARSVVDTEAVALIQDWIANVVDDSYEDADACGGGGGGFELPTCAPGEIPVIGGQCLPGGFGALP